MPSGRTIARSHDCDPHTPRRTHAPGARTGSQQILTPEGSSCSFELHKSRIRCRWPGLQMRGECPNQDDEPKRDIVIPASPPNLPGTWIYLVQMAGISGPQTLACGLPAQTEQQPDSFAKSLPRPLLRRAFACQQRKDTSKPGFDWALPARRGRVGFPLCCRQGSTDAAQKLARREA